MYKRIMMSNKRQRRTAMDPVSYDEWTEVTKDKNLTINDVRSLRPGDVLHLYALDRNMWDRVDGDIFHVQNGLKMVYTHKGGLCGSMTFYDTGCIETVDNFEFDVEVSRNRWWPFKEGRLPQGSEVFKNFCKNRSMDGAHYSSLPTSTRLGWRGPAVQTKYADSLPPISLDDW
jgi:hypothetical protein